VLNPCRRGCGSGRPSRMGPLVTPGSTRSPRWRVAIAPRRAMKIAVARVLFIQFRQSAGVAADSAAQRAASDGQIVLPAPRSANNARITCSMLTSRLARLVTVFAWILSLFCATSGSVAVATDPDASLWSRRLSRSAEACVLTRTAGGGCCATSWDSPRFAEPAANTRFL
jgi:hypothetical protein